MIYLDTGDFGAVRSFCDRFWPILEEAAKAQRPATVGAVAELTLRTYTDKLESILDGGKPKPWSSPLCSLIPKEDSALELSPMFGNVLVKPLPRERIIPVLRKAKPYLQTAGLGCEPGQREELLSLLVRAGITRVTHPGSMSESIPGEAHDGAYPLQRYLRMVDVEL